MFPFTPHTTLRLDYRSGGSSFKENYFARTDDSARLVEKY